MTKTEFIKIRISLETKERLCILSKAQHQTVSEILRSAIERIVNDDDNIAIIDRQLEINALINS